VKNFIVIYIGLITGALMGIVMPPWTSIAILVGISLYDLFAVLNKHGPIKQMIDLISEDDNEGVEEKVKKGELEYDTSSLELGIGDLVFYSMLTSSALVIENLFFLENIIMTVSSGLAIIIGAAITIQNLKKNKILPGLPISIFMGLGTLLISWTIFAFVI
jgi:presenilin-like A22 family membrane protease